MERRIYHNILIVVLIVSLLLLGVENIGLFTGHVAKGDTPSNVTISQSLAISFSPQLKSGIVFDEIQFLPANDVNASHNYDGVDNSTQYIILVSPDGNTAVDVCLRASGPLATVGGDTIPLAGETYTTSNVSNMTLPDLAFEESLTTEYILAENNIPIGGNGYVRFFLDVAAGQASGDYVNDIFFKGISNAAGC